MRNVLGDWPWALAFSSVPFVARYLRKFLRKSEDQFSAEGVFSRRVHIHFRYPISAADAAWQPPEKREICFSSVYFEDGRECMVRGICNLGTERGQKIRISKDKKGVYSVTLIS